MWERDAHCFWRFILGTPGPVSYMLKVWKPTPRGNGFVGAAIYESTDGYEDGSCDTYFPSLLEAVSWFDRRSETRLPELQAAMHEHYQKIGFQYNGCMP